MGIEQELGLGKAGEEGDGMDWEDGREGDGRNLHIYKHECHGRECSEAGKVGKKGQGAEVEHIEEPV